MTSSVKGDWRTFTVCVFGDHHISMDCFDRSIFFTDKKRRRTDGLQYLEGGKL